MDDSLDGAVPQPSAQSLLAELRALGEHARIEAKLGLGREALATACAFANEPDLGGGFLLFGIQSLAAGGYQVAGVSDPERLSSDLASQCAVQFQKPLRPRIRCELVEGLPVVIAYVPELEPHGKPLFQVATGLPRGAWRRIGATDQRCSEDDLREMLADARGLPFELEAVDGFAADDLEEGAIAGFLQMFAASNPGSALRHLDEDRLLQSLHALRMRRGRLVATVLGALLFGTRHALRRVLPAARIDFVRVVGNVWVPDAQRRFAAVEVREPAVMAFQRAFQLLMDDIPRAFLFDPGSQQRREVPQVPEMVVREALVNAIVHRSYRIGEAILVIRFSNRIEIRNPGHSLVPEETFGQPGSRSRNVYLASAFRDLRLAESKGTGIGAMRRAMRTAGLQPPLFVSDRGADRFVATIFLQNLLGDADLRWLEMLNRFRLTAPQKLALVSARSKGGTCNAELRELADIDTLSASRELKGLRDLGLLLANGAGRSTTYVLAEWLASAPSQGESAAEGEVGDAADAGRFLGARVPETGELGPETGELGPETGELGPETGELGPETGELVRQGTFRGTDQLPEELATMIRQLGKRPPPVRLRQVLLALCGLRSWTAGQLAIILGRRKVRYLVDEHLSPMVRIGQLERTDPDTPTHPAQAYRLAGGQRAP